MRHLFRWSLCLSLVLFLHVHLFALGREAVETVESADPVAAFLRAFGLLAAVPSILALGLFSRIEESRTLQHASRQRLRDLIQAEPGLGLTELSQKSGFGWGTTVYHLNRMERAGLVRSADVGRRRAFFLPEHDRRTQEIATLLVQEPQLRLLRALRGQPNASQQALAEAAGMALPLAHRYLRRMEEAGLVSSTKEWKVRRYQPTPRLNEQWDSIASGPLAPREGTRLPLRPTLSPRGTNAP